MVLQEIVYLDLNKLEKEELQQRRQAHDVLSYETYSKEDDELIIKPLSQREVEHMEFSAMKNKMTKEDAMNKVVRLPCHMNETLNFCNNVCQFKKFCGHK
jgi:hypothetical protein